MPQITDIISRKIDISFEAFSLKDFVPEVIERCTRDDLLFPLLDFLVESVDNIAAMEYKLYDNSCYRAARDQSQFGLQDLPLEDVVAGVISYFKRNDLMPLMQRSKQCVLINSNARRLSMAMIACVLVIDLVWLPFSALSFSAINIAVIAVIAVLPLLANRSSASMRFLQ